MRSFLTDSGFLEYAGKSFHANYQRSSDDFAPRVARHEFIKVDGALQEPMGQGADSYRFELVFYGPQFRAEYAAAVAHFKANPTGLLIHPLLGRKQVAVQSYSGSLDLTRELDSVSMPVAFAENAINDKATPRPSAAKKAQDVTDYLAQFNEAVSAFTAVAGLAELVDGAATDYAAAVIVAANTAVPDPSLPGLLQGVRDSVLAFNAAVLDDPAALTAADAFEARDLALRVYAAALDADTALGRTQPALEAITLPAAISLSRLCADRYGGTRARTYADLVRVLNRIANPFLIPGGTVLKLPTVAV